MKKNELIKCIQLCINSYEGKHGKEKKILSEVKKYEVNENIEYYIGKKKDTCYLIFRGSDEWKDWLQNLNTESINFDGGLIHLGFLEDHDRVQSHCFNTMAKYKKVIITGHSKGACQALLMYYFFTKKYPYINTECVAVAPAKCMSKQFREKMKNVYTIINSEDYICKVPQWKFKHMGQIIRIGFPNILFWIPIIRMIGAWIYHPPIKYLQAMKKYKKIIL